MKARLELSAATCLITGATGAIGPVVVNAFHNSGYRIRTLSLDAQENRLFPANVEECIGDIRNAPAVESASCNCELIIHLAALLHLGPQASTSYDRFREINVKGTDTVVKTAIRTGVKRIVLFSTISVYGESTGEAFDEDSATCPGSFYARTKLEAEKIVLEARRSDGQPLGTVLRLAAVYGSRVVGNYRTLLQTLAKRRFIFIGDGKNRRTLVYENDAARAALIAACHPAAAGKIYNVTDGGFHNMDEIIRTICQALGQNPPRWRLPVRPVRYVAGAWEDLAHALGLSSPIGRAQIDKYIEDLAVRGERIQRELGFVPEFDLEKGWRETILKMRNSRKL